MTFAFESRLPTTNNRAESGDELSATLWQDMARMDGNAFRGLPAQPESRFVPCSLPAMAIVDGSPKGAQAIRDSVNFPMRDTIVGYLSRSRNRLLEDVRANIADVKSEKEFVRDMQRFEKRALASGLNPFEVAYTYRQLERLFDCKLQRPTTSQDRIQLARQIIKQAADPTTITQGFHGTCNFTDVECRTYALYPSEAARLVADVAITGVYTSSRGMQLTPNLVSLKKDFEAKVGDTEKGYRSYASQIFQVTAANIGYGLWGARGRYEQHKPAAPGDTGERNFAYDGGRKLLLVNQPLYASAAEMQDVANHISGRGEKGFMLVDESIWNGTTTPIRKEQDLSNQLLRLKSERRLPAIVQVHTKHEPFWTDSGQGKAGGSGGWHVVMVTDYDQATGAVSVDNTWTKDKDHLGSLSIHISQLYKAMRK